MLGQVVSIARIGPGKASGTSPGQRLAKLIHIRQLLMAGMTLICTRPPLKALDQDTRLGSQPHLRDPGAMLTRQSA